MGPCSNRRTKEPLPVGEGVAIPSSEEYLMLNPHPPGCGIAAQVDPRLAWPDFPGSRAARRIDT